ncbi:MAG: GspE/PulE family protein [Planctomycetota bacterium]
MNPTRPIGENGTTGTSRMSGGPSPRELSRAADLFSPFKLTPEQLQQFRELDGSDEEPWDSLLSMLAIDEHEGLELLAKRTGLRYVAEPKIADSASRYYELVPADISRQHHLAGIEEEPASPGSVAAVMVVATAQPLSPSVYTMIEDFLEGPIRLVLSPRGAVANLINRGYEQRQGLVEEIIEEMPLDESVIAAAAGTAGQSTDLLQLARQTPVIRLVNMILFEALRRRASDVHVHPMENKLVIRFRIDGMLTDAFTPPISLAPAISSRMKVMTELDIANRHSPQDGHTSVRIGSRKIDIRFSCIPTVYGERLVLRLLDQTQTQLSLDQVGMIKAMQGQFMDLVERPTGIILVTGPTGSGKTTSLYAALGKIDRTSRNVMTIEDPVEYHLDGISQMQVNVKRGVTFASGLRSLLRQDPDVILVGEIRDKETADLAIQASLTGHLVLATLHTNDAPGAITRLVDIGIEPYLITSTLLGVLAQRLLRRKCKACAGAGNFNGLRCETCYGTGYRGRVAVYELMIMTEQLRRLAAQNADALQLFDAARASGFRTMHDDAHEKVAAGLTDETEVFRVLH